MNVTAAITSIQSGSSFPGASEAWRAAIDAVLSSGDIVEPVTDPFSIASKFGQTQRSTIELRSAQFTITAPRRRIIQSYARKFKLEHAVAQFFWVLCGTSDLNAITFYHTFGAKLSENGKTLFAAPGSRIFSTPFGDQFERAIACLKDDNASRRAIIQVFTPEDASGKRRDVPCFLSVQLLLRGGVLHAITTMRSQSTVMVLPHDLFLLLMLHEAAASRLKVGLGNYTHWSGSLHIYEDEVALGQAVLQENPIPSIEMPEMPPLDQSWRTALSLAELEVRTQLSSNIRQPIDLSVFGLNRYWSGLLAVLLIAARKERGQMPLGQDYQQVLPELRSLL